jgi:DNA-binding FadR family transcriptional regulator
MSKKLAAKASLIQMPPVAAEPVAGTPERAERGERADLTRVGGEPKGTTTISCVDADGLVVSRQGSGSYVMRRPSEEMISIAPAGSIADLMRCFEFRIALEGETAALAALRRTPDDLRQIDAAMQGLDMVIAQGEVGTGPDVDLHMAIARATRNKLFEISLKSIFAQLEGGMQLARSLSLRRSRVRLETVQHEHSAIVDAIRAEDSEAARAAMRAHINNARTRILTDSLEP